MKKTGYMNIQLFGEKRPTTEQIVEAIVKSGGNATIGADSAVAINAILSKYPDANDYATEFNNQIEQKYKDLHTNATIYDRFKQKASAPTVQAVVFQKIAPVDFSFKTDVNDLSNEEHTETRKIPPIHSILKSLNVQSRFKTTTSQTEINKIQNGQDIAVNDVVQNLGMSYADDRTREFEKIVDGIVSNKTKDEVSALTTMQDISDFIQKIKDYTFKWNKSRTDIYNAYKDEADSTAKADTKLIAGTKPIVFITPAKLYKIESDFYAVLFQLQQALPEVDFVELDALTGNKFAVMVDPRVIIWNEFDYEIRSEQIRGRESGELNHYLFAKDIMGEFTCFNRVIFKTA